ncbi:TIGR03086 family metal-binding protein [Streptantibioticus silvisoli]|uniref:TIGR03086 family metal-binding protein n=1 Tax=Streptantibioticus silvisoli TaxID=2705255 RepID=A0ABT6W1R4_9ACTN|nr:TIGR03086 family metal-binding protein [Streptantibioticus silvisoli]MDI5964629.1 TIGR03086 family metal-binding protein [Streptantibioticus silvisoli]
MDATSDPRPQFLAALGQLEKLVGAAEPELLGRPTPCDGFDLRALLGHTLGVAHRVAYTGEGGRGLDLPSAVGRIADTDWAGAAGRAHARVAAAWADGTALDRAVEVPWGVVPGRAALAGYLVEIVTHTWDIAQVVDPAAELDAGLAQAALDTARAFVPAEPRGGAVPFGPVSPAPDGASVHVRLAAWLGRRI